jgi:hypothetical protein
VSGTTQSQRRRSPGGSLNIAVGIYSPDRGCHSYVFYLESRIEYLEDLLKESGVPFKIADSAIIARTARNGEVKMSPATAGAETAGPPAKVNADQDAIDKLVTNASQVAVRGTSDSRYLGSASGISFARVVFAAVKKSIKSNMAVRGRSTPDINTLTASHTTMRESLFGLDTSTNVKPAPFPSRKLAERLADLFFHHSNPQFPIISRPEFMAMLIRVYEDREDRDRAPTPRESYMLNIVFAIGSGTIVGKPVDVEEQERQAEADSPEPPMKRRRLVEEQRQPEEYHASAIIHLDAMLNSSNPTNTNGPGGDLEELQAVLLLAAFALLRPVPPGLWYIVGVAVRLALDLGLHADDGFESNAVKQLGSKELGEANNQGDSPDDGFRKYISDWRRRLWWCVYSFDRLVCSVVGRPFGIADAFVTTEFPSLVRDEFITHSGFVSRQDSSLVVPTYKLVSYHYFRLRLLHSEILQVLHHHQVQLARERGLIQENPYIQRDLPCAYLKSFDDNFLLWRESMDRRLAEWNESAPTQEDAGVRFSPMFFELNYWQTIVMLYRQSLSVPSGLADDLKSVPQDVQSPVLSNLDEHENKDVVFIKVAQAGQKILKLYRQLHRKYLVNYTYLATHHLFIAGISFLYCLWYSPLVRSHLTLDDVDFTILAATSVLDDLIVFCPPARACRDAFSRMASTTIKMGIAKGGFGQHAQAAAAARSKEAEDPVDFDRPGDFTPVNSGGRRPSDGRQAPTTMDPNNPNFAYAPNSRKPSSAGSLADPVFDTDLHVLFSPSESGAAGRMSADALAQLRLQQRRLPLPQVQPQVQAGPAPGSLAFDVAPPTASAFSTPVAVSPRGSVNQADLGAAFTFSPQWGSDLDFLETVSVPDQVLTGNVDVPVDPLAMDGMGYGWDGSFTGLNWEDGSGSIDLFNGFFFGGSAGPNEGGL